MNAASLGAKAPLNVLPEKIPAVTGSLPSASQAQVAKLHGITFVAIDEPKPVTTMSLFVKAGSRYEEEGASAGAANFLKRLAFRSTEKKYYYPLVLDVDKHGIEFEAAAGREFVSYNLTGLRSDSGLMAETLGAVYQPRLEEWEVEAVRAEVLAESESNARNSRQTLLDLVYREAFRDQGLGRSPSAAAFEAESLSPAALRQYVNSHYTADRLIVVANGASMDEIKSFADSFAPYDVRSTINDALGPGIEGYFPVLTPAKPVHPAKVIYTGGSEVRLPGAGPTQLVVAAEGVGASAGIQAQLAAAVLQTIVGGGSSALRGVYPGLHQSRLANLVACSGGCLQYAETFHHSFSDAGLFGIFAQAHEGHGSQLAAAISQHFQTLSVVSDAEVSRAKLQLKANILNSFASDPVALTEFYANQISNTGSALTPSQFVAQIESVDTASVVAVAKKIAASKLTVAALGDVKGLPKF